MTGAQPQISIAPPLHAEPLPVTVARSLELERHPQVGRPSHLSAASGLQVLGRHTYVVADDELHLGHFPTGGTAPGSMLRAMDGHELPLEPAARKRRKPDIEALLRLPAGGAAAAPPLLVGVPSGSTPARTTGFAWQLQERDAGLTGSPAAIDFAPLYDALRGRVRGTLNIEGAAVRGTELVLFHRGNGRGGVAATITLDLARLDQQLRAGRVDASTVSGVREYDLGALRGAALGFTDATPLPDGRILFAAAAELSQDAVADGEVTGSAIGIVGTDGSVQQLQQVGGTGLKVEGLAIAQSHDGRALLDGSGRMRLHLVTDADDPSQPAQLLTATVEPHDLPAR